MAPATKTRGLLQIGDVAERTGLSLRSVRHYEDVGLLPPAERSPGGFRLYTEAAVERLLVVKQMKPLEFTLDEMRALLDAQDELAAGPAPDRRRDLQDTLSAYRALVEQKVSQIEQRLAGARALDAALGGLIHYSSGTHTEATQGGALDHSQLRGRPHDCAPALTAPPRSPSPATARVVPPTGAGLGAGDRRVSGRRRPVRGPVAPPSSRSAG